jgi:signal transduction histidine kinase
LRAWRVFLALAVLAAGGYFLVPSIAAQDVYYVVFGLATVGAIVGGVRLNRPRRPLLWYLLAAGQLTFIVGDLVWAVYEVLLHVETPFPSLADVFYLAGYPFTAAGLLLLVRGRRTPGRDEGNLIDAGIVATGLGLLFWVFLIAPYGRDPSLSGLERVISMAYPVMDVLVLAVAVRLVFTRGARTAAYRFLVASFFLYLVADAVYSVMVLAGTYQSGSFVDAGWLLSYALLAVGALHPSMRTLSEPGEDRETKLTRRRLVVLAGVSLLAPALLGLGAARASLDAPLIAGSVALFLLVLVRMANLVREVEANARVIQDQRVQLEAEKRVVAELRELNRMKTEFVAVASHELRTPLTSMIGFARTLERSDLAEDSQSRRNFLRIIVEQGDRLLRLVENLLMASQVDGEGIRPGGDEVVLADFCREIVDGLGPDASRVRLAIPSRLPLLTTDRQLLARVLTNLLDNALKYSLDRAGCEIGARREDDLLVFWVEDHGIGIPAEQLERIFDRFYQVDSSSTRSFGGTGLGLSLVKDLLRLLNGSIEVESELGRGSRFTVRLPIGKPATDAVVEPIEAALPAERPVVPTSA